MGEHECGPAGSYYDHSYQGDNEPLCRCPDCYFRGGGDVCSMAMSRRFPELQYRRPAGRLCRVRCMGMLEVSMFQVI